MAILRTLVNGTKADANDCNFNFTALNNESATISSNLSSLSASTTQEIANLNSAISSINNNKVSKSGDTITGNLTVEGNITPRFIELVPETGAATGGFIDFHFGGSSEDDFTSRIIEDTSAGHLSITAPNGLYLNGSRVLTTLDTHITSASSAKIELSNKVCIQCGRKSVNGHYDLTFPNAFASEPYVSLNKAVNDNSGDDSIYIVAHYVSGTGMRIVVTDTDDTSKSARVDWIAIGTLA